MPKRKGIQAARAMRHRKQGGFAATPDGFDRSDQRTLASLVDQWLARLETRAYSPRTVAARTWALRSFLTWAEARGLLRPAQLDKLALEGFQRWLWLYRKANDQPLAIATQRGHLGAVQGFFAWLCRENLLPANPAADLELPRKQPRSLPRALSLAEVETILAVPDTSDPLGQRDRAILETLYGTGLRRRELVNLDVADIDRSLGDKIKSLILIPVISQTYCDPLSFAWGQEFLAFKAPNSQSTEAATRTGVGNRTPCSAERKKSAPRSSGKRRVCRSSR